MGWFSNFWKYVGQVFAPKPEPKPEPKPQRPEPKPQQPEAAQQPDSGAAQQTPEPKQPTIKPTKEASMTRKALVVGIDKYWDPKWNLQGCTMDAAVMSGVFQDHFDFPGDNIRVLMNERATQKSILSRLEWLVDGAKPGDVLAFFYAGHGSQVRDRDGDELQDHMDEILCPHDLNWDDPLTDDILHSYFKKVPKGVNLTVIFDCCNSGTGTRSFWAPVSEEGEVLGETEYRKVRFIRPPIDIEHRSRGMAPLANTRYLGQAQDGTEHIVFAACQPHQQAQEVRIGGDVRGAFSYYLVRTLKRANWNLNNYDADAGVSMCLKDEGFVQLPWFSCPKEYQQKPILAPFS